MKSTFAKQLKRTTIIYWLMLMYIIAALLWWYISLEKQSATIQQLSTPQLTNAPLPTISSQQLAQIKETRRRESVKHTTEGLFFLGIIIVFATFVSQAVRRRLKIQEQQQNFMMAITHELKTPIAISQINMETLLKHKLDAAQQEKLLRATLEETKRLNALTSNILVASRLEENKYSAEKEPLSLSTLLEKNIAEFEQRYSRNKFSRFVDQQITIKADVILIQLLISNLLDNAIKYSPKESTIQIFAKVEKKWAQIQIVNEGTAISADEKGKIFNKFYRSGQESTRLTKGTGLGLFICHKIVKEHKGTLTVNDNPAGGSIFTITIPIYGQ